MIRWGRWGKNPPHCHIAKWYPNSPNPDFWCKQLSSLEPTWCFSAVNNPLQIGFETHNPYCPEWGQNRWRFSFLTILSFLTNPSTESLSWPFSQWASSTASRPTSPGTTPCTPAQQHTKIWHPGMTECSQQCDPIPELGENNNNNNRKRLFSRQTQSFKQLPLLVQRYTLLPTPLLHADLDQMHRRAFEAKFRSEQCSPTSFGYSTTSH